MTRGPGLVVLLSLAGAVGSVVRWTVEGRVQSLAPGGVPAGTLLVNLVGSFALGVVTGAAVPAWVLAVVGAGFCGGLTTFSTVAVQAVERRRRSAAAYLAVTVVLGLVVAALGLIIGTALA
jgi:fluoride exporter